jgi:DNA modification methylase
MGETFLGGRVTMLLGDVRERLRGLPADHFDCVVTSPPYWGLRDYGTATWEGGDDFCDHRSPTMKDGRNEVRATIPGSVATNSAQLLLAHRSACGRCGAVKVDRQIGLEPTLGEHLAVMVEVFEEVRRVLKPTGTLWLNYGDCYATAPNGRSAADIKMLGTDDRSFRDKPFSTIGAIYDHEGGQVPDNKNPKARAGVSGNRGNTAVDHGGRIRANGGYLKSKDLCMIPNRLAIALQEAGWWVRSEIIWHKPNPMPESITDRPTTSHEKIWLLTKSELYFYDADAIAERVQSGPSDIRKMEQSLPRIGGKHKDLVDPLSKANSTTKIGLKRSVGGKKIHGNVPGRDDGGRACNNPSQLYRNSRNVWTIGTAAFSEAHFATFPPELAERCIKAGSPAGGSILDPFGGSGTTAMVAASLGRTATLIELNPEYATLARARIEAAFMGREEGARHMVKKLGKLAVDAGPLFDIIS